MIMGTLATPPRMAFKLAFKIVGGWFGDTVEMTSLAVPVHRFDGDPKGFLEGNATNIEGWKFFIYSGERPIGMIGVSCGEVPRFMELEVPKSILIPGNFEMPDEFLIRFEECVRILDDLIDDPETGELHLIEAPSWRASFFWFQGRREVFVDRLNPRVLRRDEVKLLMQDRQERIDFDGLIFQPAPRDPEPDLGGHGPKV
jgi:hypothetical protein